jgi:hypothetical protein
VDVSGTTITFLSYTADGFGNVTFPGGQSLPAIRVTRDKIITRIRNNIATRDPKTRHIDFYAQDLTELSFEVDTTYSGGSAPGINYEYHKRNLALGVAKKETGLPTGFQLSQNYPNPFNPTTTITFQLPQRNLVNVKIYDVLGREVASLLNETLDAGRYDVSWNASVNPSGVYYYRMQAGKFSDVKKLLLLK